MKKLITAALIVILALGISARIYYVNANRHKPVLIEAAQGEKIEFGYVEYSVESAAMWDYNDFFEQYPQYSDYGNMPNGNDYKLLLVNLKYEMSPRYNEEETHLQSQLYITYPYSIEGSDPFFMSDMNDAETVKATHVYTIPFNIYTSDAERWNNDVEHMEFRIVFGTYPERKELIVSDYEVIDE
ncbi:MAG: hypothetical protein NC393_08955 [Clostridium sp.]|nr:hypothetical protein [Clostridium sp.]MCM1172240.1 hypothetical protein [Clostridium sp.]MCM1209278.1 hypothetical protein [Ruminococcus sp.]